MPNNPYYLKIDRATPPPYHRENGGELLIPYLMSDVSSTLGYFSLEGITPASALRIHALGTCALHLDFCYRIFLVDTSV